MHEIVLIQLFESIKDLMEVIADLNLTCQSFFSSQFVEKITQVFFIAELQHDINKVFFPNNILNLDNVWILAQLDESDNLLP